MLIKTFLKDSEKQRQEHNPTTNESFFFFLIISLDKSPDDKDKWPWNIGLQLVFNYKVWILEKPHLLTSKYQSMKAHKPWPGISKLEQEEKSECGVRWARQSSLNHWGALLLKDRESITFAGKKKKKKQAAHKSTGCISWSLLTLSSSNQLEILKMIPKANVLYVYK
jgi:hypothetical protein